MGQSAAFSALVQVEAFLAPATGLFAVGGASWGRYEGVLFRAEVVAACAMVELGVGVVCFAEIVFTDADGNTSSAPIPNKSRFAIAVRFVDRCTSDEFVVVTVGTV